MFLNMKPSFLGSSYAKGVTFPFLAFLSSCWALPEAITLSLYEAIGLYFEGLARMVYLGEWGLNLIGDYSVSYLSNVLNPVCLYLGAIISSSKPTFCGECLDGLPF